MRNVKVLSAAAMVAMSVTGSALAQSDIDNDHKYCWTENTGWLNWRDANGSADGVEFHGTYLSGYVWGENIGWINFGDGTPANGTSYANANGTDFGVNIAPNGDLFGLAWGENVGWINMDTRGTLTPHGQQARFDGGAGRFRGYGWGENIGWVNMDDAVHYVGVLASCPADCDGNGFVTSADVGCFLTLYFGDLTNGTTNADCDGNGVTTSADVGCFLTLYFASIGACP